MPDERLVLALDQGTTSSRAIAFDRAGTPVALAHREFPQGFPSPGHVTHDPEDIWSSQVGVARAVIAAVGGPERIAAIGITNQRETTVVWERATGRPVAPAIVWQSRVTAPFCEELRASGVEDRVRALTGLPIDAYFSGPKIRHILREGDLRGRAERGELAFGTVDSFLVWRLTGGRVHATDVSNASRTLLLDIASCTWSDELLRVMEVPRAVLPEIRPSSGVWAETDPAIFGRALPIAGVAGDQQAATFGQACFAAGEAKNTYGTGAFLLLNTGASPVVSRHGLLSTVLWQLGPGQPVAYALEGSVFVAGAAVQWLRDGLRAIASSDAIEALVGEVTDTGGVYFVPAFVGLGAPHWDPHARGLLIGLTRGTGLPEIARATLESIAYQVLDVVDAMAADRGAHWRTSAWTAVRPGTTPCCGSRRTCWACPWSGRASRRPPRGEPRRWRGSRWGSGTASTSSPPSARSTADSSRRWTPGDATDSCAAGIARSIARRAGPPRTDG
jgi:glycerol kinase